MEIYVNGNYKPISYSSNCMHIAVVILNYNSEKDLKIVAEQISRQLGVFLSIILIDNASRADSLESIKSWLSLWCPDAVYGDEKTVQSFVRDNPEITKLSGNVYFVENKKNKGYSAGNNIGIRLADILKADAVLVVNPDMRIEDAHYIKELSRQIFSDPSNYVAASRIINFLGNEQNPLRESTFLEELLWPRECLKRFFKKTSYVLPCMSVDPVTVHKVSGCCLMLRMDFLRLTSGFDENVFLYSEEPILASVVSSLGGRIIYVPKILAIHAHDDSQKKETGQRMLLFIRSRKYYLKTYSGYPWWQLQILFSSYAIFSFFNRLRRFLGK